MKTSPRISPSLLADWRRSLALGVWTSLGLVATVVLLRRLSGAFTRELSPVAFFGILLAAVILLLIPHLLLAAISRDQDDPSRSPRTLVSLLLLILLIASVIPISNLWAWGLAIGFLTATATVSRFPRRFLDACRSLHTRLREKLPDLFPPIPVEQSPSAKTDLSTSQDDLDPHLVSNLTRSDTPESTIVSGTLRVHFPVGLKQTNLHVPFVPPLDSVEQAECHCSGENIELKLGSLYTYGLRLEARRSSPLEPLTTTAEFEVIVPHSPSV